MSGDSIDKIGISQSVDILATTHYERIADDTLSLEQAVSPVTSIWKHIRAIVAGELGADTLGISQSVVSKEQGTCAVGALSEPYSLP